MRYTDVQYADNYSERRQRSMIAHFGVMPSLRTPSITNFAMAVKIVICGRA